MATIAPFRALRPLPEFAPRVAAPPYDVVSLDEARAIAADNPYSFLRVSRAELEFPDGTDPYAEDVYRRGAENLRDLVRKGVFRQESEPVLGIYRQTAGTHRQTGVVALASVQEYDRGVIKKHEHTRPTKEADRVRLIETHESQSGPVLLFFRDSAGLGRRLEDATSAEPEVRFTADDGVEHAVWSMRDEASIAGIVEDFRAVDTLYIADGHHRSAAASRARVQCDDGDTLTSDAAGFLAVIVPHDQLEILPYNRVVRDLNGMTPEQFIERLTGAFALEPTSSPGNPPPLGFDCYIDGRWRRATPTFAPPDDGDPTQSLAVSVLSDRVLSGLLEVTDQRSDSRVDFVGGITGPAELAGMVDGGAWSAAFWLYPSTTEELMAVSDADNVMPPKSTWFEPKLRDGLFVHMLCSPRS